MTLGDGDIFAAGPVPGAPLLNRHLGEDDFLLDHLGQGFTLVYFTEADSIDPLLRDQLATLNARGSHVKLLTMSQHEHFAAFDAEDGTAYLVRPDGHVATRWRSFDLVDLVPALDLAQGQPQPLERGAQ